jgi:predicted kinase
MLVMVCGLPGTGKTVTSKQIASDIDANIFGTDYLRKRMFKQGTAEEIEHSSNPLQFDLEFAFDKQKAIPEKYERFIWRQKEMVYDNLFKQISESLAKRLNVVLDATFYAKELRGRIYEIAKKAKDRIFLVECVCSEEILKKRFQKRTRKLDNFSYVDKMEVFRLLKSKFEDPVKDGMPILIYDTGTQKIAAHNFSNEDKNEMEKLKYSLEKLNLKLRSISVA